MASSDWTDIINTIISGLCQNDAVTPQQLQIGLDFARKLIPDTQSNYMTMAQDILAHDFGNSPVYSIIFAQSWINNILVNVICTEKITEISQAIRDQLGKISFPYLPGIMPNIQHLYQIGQVVELRENYDSAHYRLSCSLQMENTIITCLWILRSGQADKSISMSLPIPGSSNMELNLQTEE